MGARITRTGQKVIEMANSDIIDIYLNNKLLGVGRVSVGKHRYQQRHTPAVF